MISDILRIKKSLQRHLRLCPHAETCSITGFRTTRICFINRTSQVLFKFAGISLQLQKQPLGRYNNRRGLLISFPDYLYDHPFFPASVKFAFTFNSIFLIVYIYVPTAPIGRAASPHRSSERGPCGRPSRATSMSFLRVSIYVYPLRIIDQMLDEFGSKWRQLIIII